MPLVDSVFDFSRCHCVAICAVLVPLNLLTTLRTLLLSVLSNSQSALRLNVAIATGFALLLLCHVLSWFLVGVVRVPTYILLVLAGVCLGLNGWMLMGGKDLLKTLWLYLPSLNNSFNTQIGPVEDQA